MTWNYRIVVALDDSVSFREVFYDGDDRPALWTAEPMDVVADDLAEFESRVAAAVLRPVLYETKAGKLKERR